MPDIAHYLLEHFAFLAPVVNDIVLYLDEVTDHDLAISLRPRLEAIIGLEAMARQLVRFWIENYIARYPEYMASHALAKFIYGGPNIEYHALVAITTKYVAWVRAH
ncbi:MAG: hypothetical protein JJ992_22335 [Planctomycetes bacterium]|nr:hypothetical protein [Planctomycetota bacterium]